MPKFRHPELKGNLYVKFEVIFPNQFQADEEFVSVSCGFCKKTDR